MCVSDRGAQRRNIPACMCVCFFLFTLQLVVRPFFFSCTPRYGEPGQSRVKISVQRESYRKGRRLLTWRVPFDFTARGENYTCHFFSLSPW